MAKNSQCSKQFTKMNFSRIDLVNTPKSLSCFILYIWILFYKWLHTSLMCCSIYRNFEKIENFQNFASWNVKKRPEYVIMKLTYLESLVNSNRYPYPGRYHISYRNFFRDIQKLMFFGQIFRKFKNHPRLFDPIVPVFNQRLRHK